MSPRQEKHEQIRDPNTNKMNGSLPKRYPQTTEQIHNDNMRRKETRVYKNKIDKGERKQNISELIERGMIALENADEMGKIPLSDTQRVKEQTMVYLNQCMEDGVLPDNQSFALALGHTTSSVQYYIRTKPETDETRIWLEHVKELFSSMLSQAALSGDANNIFAIFSQKANFGWREDKHIVVENVSPLGLPKSDKEIAKLQAKYALDADFEEVDDNG